MWVSRPPNSGLKAAKGPINLMHRASLKVVGNRLNELNTCHCKMNVGVNAVCVRIFSTFAFLAMHSEAGSCRQHVIIWIKSACLYLNGTRSRNYMKILSSKSSSCTILRDVQVHITNDVAQKVMHVPSYGSIEILASIHLSCSNSAQQVFDSSSHKQERCFYNPGSGGQRLRNLFLSELTSGHLWNHLPMIIL